MKSTPNGNAALPWLPLQAVEQEPGADAHLRIEGLELGYAGKLVLRGVNLEFKRGAITALVGPSGCGKSSLLMSLNRLTDLVPGCFVRGKVWLGTEQVLDPKLDLIALRRRVGMIFQRPNPFPFSIARNLSFPLAEHGVKDRAVVAALIEKALADVGLWNEVKDRLGAPALALSGGQQQRLCLARALILKPEVLLLDEPCSALDPMASGVVEDLIMSLRGRYTVVMVTHNLAQARRVAEQMAVFWVEQGVGCLVENGPTEQLFSAPKNELTRAYVNGQRG